MSESFLIAGLGNPGKAYELTRHNIGFMLIDALTQYFESSNYQKKFNSELANASLEKSKIFFAKPQTYMNKSGTSISEITRFYKIPITNIIVIHDDLDLEFLKIKVKTGGGDGGHNGLKSVDSMIGKNYSRLRIGIAHPGSQERVNNYVLGKFKKDELEKIAAFFDVICNNFHYLIGDNRDKFLNKLYL